MTTKRLIVALSFVASALIMAIIALSWPEWFQKPLAGMEMIPNTWTLRVDGSTRWSDYVFGAGYLGMWTSVLFLYGKSPWRRTLAILVAGVIWGLLSWFAGAFIVVAGLWAVLATMYATKRFDVENRERVKKKEGFALGRDRWEAAGSLLLGSGFALGIKYGFTQAFFFGPVLAAITFVLPVAIAEIVCLIESNKTHPEVVK